VKNFIGREKELAKISSYFDCEVKRPRILVLHALGGQGKSQIALEYCQRSRTIYHGVFWINSSSKITTVQSLVSIARELDGSTAEVLNGDGAKLGSPCARSNSGRSLVDGVDNYDDPYLSPMLSSLLLKVFHLPRLYPGLLIFLRRKRRYSLH